MRAVSSSALDLKVLEIDDFALDALESARSKLSKTTPHAVDDVASAGLHWLSGVLGSDEIEAVAGFKTSRHEALLLRGLPLMTNVATPRTGFLADDECVLDFDL